MKRAARVGLLIAVAVATTLVALAFLVAPHACEGGLRVYFACGALAVFSLFALPFIARIGNSLLARTGAAFGFALFAAGAWVVGFFAANVRFICGLGYL